MRPETLVGLRYNVCIPANATITRAWVRVTASDSDSVASTARIRIERVPNAASFQANPSIIGRLASTSEVSWTMPSFVDGQTYDTPSLNALITEIINLPGWSGCGNVVLVFENVQNRDIVAFDGSAAAAAVLNIDFTS